MRTELGLPKAELLTLQRVVFAGDYGRSSAGDGTSSTLTGFRAIVPKFSAALDAFEGSGTGFDIVCVGFGDIVLRAPDVRQDLWITCLSLDDFGQSGTADDLVSHVNIETATITGTTVDILEA